MKIKNETYLVYKITNKTNKKVYIGSTVNINKRWYSHCQDAKYGRGSYFQRAILKYGPSNFEIEILEKNINEDKIDDREQWYIDFYNSTNLSIGYNAIGVLNGSRQLIKETMIDEWANPEKRKIRVESMRNGSKHRFKPVVSVNINSGEVTFFENVHDAMRSGVSTFGLYECLAERDKKAMGYCWFYNITDDTQYYQNEALKLLGRFKTEFTEPIIAINLKTGERLTFKDIYEARDKLGIKPKTINRVLKKIRQSAKGFAFEFKKS